VGYKLAKPQVFIKMYKLDKLQFIAFLTTVIAIVATDLLKGIGIGMAVAVFYILRRTYQNAANLVKEEHDGEEVYRLILAEETTFLNKASIARTLSELPENCTVIIDGEKSFYISYDVLENIQEFSQQTSKLKNIKVLTKGIDSVTSVGKH
jgi:MFS superfamily sulfate permease-like transporter